VAGDNGAIFGAILGVAAGAMIANGMANAQGYRTIRVAKPRNPAPTLSYAQEEPALLWNHNGSSVNLVAQGRSRKFFYDQPRSGMLSAGARSGSMIFDGEAVGQQYRGTAYIFTSRCGQFPYPVTGPILDDYRRVELRGQAPRVDDNCHITGYIDDLLEFQLIEPTVTTLPHESYASSGSSFHPAISEPLEKNTSLECVPVQSTDNDRRDPIYKISVNISFGDNWSPEDMSISHYAISGASYNRADQYTRSDLTQTPGKTDYYWTGTWTKNSAVTMRGNLMRSTTNKWTYSEQQFKYGIPEFGMLSVCHSTESE
jgi:hypothetical protein